MKKEYMKYVLSLLIFGTNGIVASHISLGSTGIVLFRTVIGSLFLLVLLLASKHAPRFSLMKGQWRWIFISGASMGLSWILLFEAYRRVGVGTATLVYYLGPVMVMAAAPFLFREKVTVFKIIGIGGAIVGMALVNFSGMSGGFSVGLLCGLLSAVLYAVMILGNKKVNLLSGLERTWIQLVIAGMVVIADAVVTKADVFTVTGSQLIPLFILGVVNTGVACYLYFSSMHRLPAGSVAMCSYIDPLSALCFSAIFLGERMGPLQLIGAALILGGAAFGELYRPKRERSLQQEETAL